MNTKNKHIFIEKVEGSSVVLKPEIVVKTGNNKPLFGGEQKNRIRIPLNKNFGYSMKLLENFRESLPCFHPSQ